MYPWFCRNYTACELSMESHSPVCTPDFVAKVDAQGKVLPGHVLYPWFYSNWTACGLSMESPSLPCTPDSVAAIQLVDSQWKVIHRHIPLILSQLYGLWTLDGKSFSAMYPWFCSKCGLSRVSPSRSCTLDSIATIRLVDSQWKVIPRHVPLIL